MTVTDFHLPEYVREVIDGTDLASPAEIAEHIVNTLDPHQLRAALRQALPTYVRAVVAHERTKTRLGGMLPPVTGSGPTGPPNTSAKVRAIRNAAPGWKQALHDRIHVGGGNWKLLGDCTYDDLLFAANERRAYAKRNSEAADRFDRLAALLHRVGARSVAALPEDELAAELGDDAPEAEAS